MKRRSEKLKGVEENLVRISDITTELEGQRGPLKRQSEKARKYLTYYEEYKGLDVNLSIITIDKTDLPPKRQTGFITVLKKNLPSSEQQNRKQNKKSHRFIMKVNKPIPK